MAQIPSTPGRSRMPGNVGSRQMIGGFVDPNDLGSENFRNWQKLGQNITGGGRTQMGWAIDKYDREQDAEARAEYAEYAKGVNNYRNQILSTTGSNAKDAVKEMEETSRMHAEASLARLTTPQAKERFDRYRQNYDIQNVNAAGAHATRQNQAYWETTVQANIAQEIENAAANAAAGVSPAGNIQLMKQYNQELYAGQPREFIDLKNRETASLAVESVANSLAINSGPQAALDFLNSGVEQEIGDGALKTKFNALRKKYEDAAENVTVAEAAIAFVRNNGKSEDVLATAWARYPDDKAQRDLFINTADSQIARNINARNTARVQEVDDGYQALVDADFNAEQIPAEIRNSNPKLYRELVEYANWIGKAGNQKLDPDLAWLDQMEMQTPSELRAWLAETPEEGQPSNYEILWRKAGGSREDVNRIRARARMTDEQAAGTGGKGGSGGSTATVDSMYFKDVYGGIYKSSIRGRPLTYDEDGDLAERRNNGWMLRMRDRIANGDSEWKGSLEMGRSPNEQELNQIRARLAKDVIEKRVNLDSSFYSESQQPTDANPRIPKAPEQVTPETKAVIGNVPVITMNNQDGKPEDFGVLDLNNTSTSAGVHEDISRAGPLALEALVATSKGTIGTGAMAVSYEPGWKIVRMKDGTTILYDSGWNYKDHTRSLPTAAQTTTVNGIGAPDAVAAQPRKSRGMEAKVAQLKKQYNTKEAPDNVSEKWDGANWNITYPGGVWLFNANGEDLGSMLNVY